MSEIIRQLIFRPPLPDVFGCQDYRDKRNLYETIDELIDRMRLDDTFVSLVLQSRNFDPESVGDKFYSYCITAFRTCILRFVESHLSMRELSIQLSESHLLQWFCMIESFGPIRVPSKSTLDRYGRLLSEDQIDELGAKLLRSLAEPNDNDDAKQVLGLEQPLDLTHVWLDGFCVDANVHFPVDWVLFIDAARTLMNATILIRDAGLNNRMPISPKAFLKEMNKLGIAMSQQSRQKDSKRNRKKILRLMKKLMKKIQKHAQYHRDLLESKWEETKWSWPQAQQVIDRIDGILAQLPAAEKQAHERIIGERQVKNSEKILSLYETEIEVIVRGKLGRNVEFGNQLWIGEQRDGLILHHQMYKEVVSDANILIPTVERIEERLGIEIEGVCADRGCGSKAHDNWLDSLGKENYVCPRVIEDLQEKMKNGEFAERQKRRSQTEGRISIFVHRFLGGLLRVKGFKNRNAAVNWAVLAHNLWKLAKIRKTQADEREREKGSQAA
jgi:hypothetical protein